MGHEDAPGLSLAAAGVVVSMAGAQPLALARASVLLA
jgi:hypothetical protein